MVDKTIPVDTRSVDGIKKMEECQMDMSINKEKKPCYRCGKPCSVNELKLLGYLCESCLPDVEEILEACVLKHSASTSDTKLYSFGCDGEVRNWAIYTNNEDEIMEITRDLRRNLVPVNGWEIEAESGTSYLFVIGAFNQVIIRIMMSHIAPNVTTTHIMRILDEETDNQRALGRLLSNYILGAPCGNKLEMSIHDVGETIAHAADLINAGLPSLEVIDKVLSKFYVSDPTTRKYAFIGSLLSTAVDDVNKMKEMLLK